MENQDINQAIADRIRERIKQEMVKKSLPALPGSPDPSTGEKLKQMMLPALPEVIGLGMPGVGDAVNAFRSNYGTKPKDLVAPLAAGTMAALSPVGLPAIGAAALGGGGVEAYKQIGEHIQSDPNAPKTSGEAFNRIAKAGNVQGLIEAAGQGLGAGVNAPYQIARKVPAGAGSVLDSMGGLEKGSGEVAIKNPEVTEPGYFTNRIKQFVTDLSDRVNKLEDEAKTFFEKKIQQYKKIPAKVDSGDIRSKLEDLKTEAGIKTGLVTDSAGSGPANASDPFLSSRRPMIEKRKAIPGVTSVGNDTITGLEDLNPTKYTTKIDGGSKAIDVGHENDLADAARILENTFNKFKTSNDATLGSSIQKPKLGLPELLELRQKADSLAGWAKANKSPAEGRISKFRHDVDGFIRDNYKGFKPADEKYAGMLEDVQNVKEAFGVGDKTSTGKIKDVRTAEKKVLNTLKKGELETDVLAQFDKSQGTKFLPRAEKLAAAGSKDKQFEKVLRPGAGYATLTGGLFGGGAAMAAGLNHPGLAVAAALGEGANLAATSPRVIGKLLRSEKGLVSGSRNAVTVGGRGINYFWKKYKDSAK